jgi:hypothetical protein
VNTEDQQILYSSSVVSKKKYNAIFNHEKIIQEWCKYCFEKACIFTVLQCVRQKARQGKVNHGIEKPAAASGLFGARQASSSFCTAL